VEHGVGGVDQLAHERPVQHGVDRVREPRIRLVGLEVLDAARRQVVDHAHVVPPPEQLFQEMGADEARAARHERSRHGRRPWRRVAM
jgi:hypothetical protein